MTRTDQGIVCYGYIERDKLIEELKNEGTLEDYSIKAIIGGLYIFKLKKRGKNDK